MGKGRGDEDSAVIERLLSDEDPSIRWATRALVLKEPESRALSALRRSIADSPRAKALLSHRGADGRIGTNPYCKWQGPHWTLYFLARLHYPAGGASLVPLRDQVYDWLLEKAHLEFPRSLRIEGQEDRFRRCGTQEGNAIWYSILLGLDDERTRELAHRLVAWQWPDGGWNCDKRPEARASSTVESLVPLRALDLAAKAWGEPGLAAAAKRTAEWFLARRFHYRLRDGKAIDKAYFGPWESIAHPVALWDVLSCLGTMADIGLIGDPRCAEALELLRSKRLSGGGFPAEYRSAVTSATRTTRGTWADWGPFGRGRENPFVTVEALRVLAAADAVRG
jgi:hypothetical protein